MSRDIFDGTHVAPHKHENEVEWLGTKREMSFQLLTSTTKLPFQVLSTGSRPMVEKVLEKIVRHFYFS